MGETRPGRVLGLQLVAMLLLIHSPRSHELAEVTTVDKTQQVLSFQSEDGDTIDCIGIYQQPAFHHPLLRNHTIQMAPSHDLTTEAATIAMPSQLWQKRGSCPKGTIPIQRKSHTQLLNGGRKSYQQNRSLAILLTYGYSYSGAKGDIKVWNPYVESEDEYSTSQISLKSGPYYDYETIESGWAVNPGVYGDNNTRLFVYWTADASKTTGCFDLTCPGFIQTNNEIVLGGSIYPVSFPGGLPYQLAIYIFKDLETNNWWVKYGGKINLGYWPPDLFTLLAHHAETVQWGGEVYSTKLGRPPHTATAMGNGQFSESIFGNSGWVKRMRVRENSLLLKFPEWVQPYSDEYNCYDYTYVVDYVEEPEFYYGGPGKNPMCP